MKPPNEAGTVEGLQNKSYDKNRNETKEIKRKNVMHIKLIGS